ncbi:MAG: FKBP-type peptidyl-prolyl cis-trans isomerase [Gammaproteobacteria bacterium]|nr:FKBP-type peptidyl-prolyl cis-trans isomerase [Gammaproteobacteria bacterium]
MHFSLALPDGTEAVSTFGGEPELVVVGDGSLTEGLELAIIGLKKGDRQTLELTPEQAFGAWDEDKLQWMSRKEFSSDLALEPGLAIAFTTPSGDEVPGTITEVGAERVNVDFNHPLAGVDIVFSVEIIEVEEPAS